MPKYTEEQVSSFSPRQLGEVLGETWGTNDVEGFRSLFTDDARIHHPLFQEPISVDTALDILNISHSGITKPSPLEGFAGEEDGGLIFSFAEAGAQNALETTQIGVMQVLARKRGARISELDVKGYRVRRPAEEEQQEVENLRKSRPQAGRKGRSDRELDDLDPEGLAKAIGQAWGENDMTTFLALFTPDAVVYHPLFEHPVPPRTAAEVLNGAVAVSTSFVSASVREDGKYVDMVFAETGQEVQENRVVGLMHVGGAIHGNRFSRLDVTGYTVE